MEAKELINIVETVQSEGSNHEELQDVDEAEETLSLCDLVAYCSQESENYSSINDDFSKEQSSSDEDFFEFFSEDFTASTYPKDNIMFCGKLIRYKEHPVREQTQITNNTVVNKKKKLIMKKKRIVPWKSFSFNKAKSSTTSSKQQQQREKGYKPQNYEYDNDSNTVSPIANSIKSRWYLLAFGYGRFPIETELRDIKKRQKRRSNIPYATMFRLDNTGGEKIKRRNEKRSSGRSLWRLWRVLRVLVCKSQEANNLT
ncbi:hypothetical protein Pint_25166 [Pistacia integerrima]|uniref:Uncharacterized protein n=1 Tax=Pistacia integerrima TaxID=434235 RepID=A0ACC0YCX8_9ROSI|nr:hypothetical protein Pint_25166 [Pistacia integerrima]